MSIEIPAGEIVQLVHQFLIEQGLEATASQLEKEAGLRSKSIADLDIFVNALREGAWHVVLRQLKNCYVPKVDLFDIYEQLTRELAEIGELEAARDLLWESDVLQHLKELDRDRFAKLERLLGGNIELDEKIIYGDRTRQQWRDDIAERILAQYHSAKPGQLMDLLTYALRFQHQEGLLLPGSDVSLFSTDRLSHRQVVLGDVIPTKSYAEIKFGRKNHANCACFSPDGAYLVTGTVDGFIELWDYRTGKLCQDLVYQATEQYMFMADPVICLAFSRDSKQLVSGSQSGQIKVWQVATGKCLRVIENAHPQGVTFLCFMPSEDGRSASVLSGGYEGTLKVHGLKSGKMLKEFRGHKGAVSSAIFLGDGNRMLSGAVDGELRVWDVQTATCLFSNALHHPPCTINSILLAPSSISKALVCSQNDTLLLVNSDGQTLKRFQAPALEFCSMTLSASGKYAYAASRNGNVACFRLADQSIESRFSLNHPKGDILVLAHHPEHDILASVDDKGLLKLWKP